MGVFKSKLWQYHCVLSLQINKLKLQIDSFVNELAAYTENVNEIDEETINLLTDTIASAKKVRMRINLKHNDASSSPNESDFLEDLNDGIFKCKRHIVCCWCDSSICMIFSIIQMIRSKLQFMIRI